MIFTVHELYDLKCLLVTIRSDVKDASFPYVLENAVSLYKDENSEIDDNRLRKMLIGLDICGEKWHTLRHENRYAATGFLKNDEHNRFLIDGLDELKNLLAQKQYDQAYDLADALHNYPEVVAKNPGKKIPKWYWKVYSYYSKKWKIPKKNHKFPK